MSEPELHKFSPLPPDERKEIWCAICDRGKGSHLHSDGGFYNKTPKQVERERAAARQRALLDGMRAIADLRDNYDGDPLNQWQSKAFAALAAFLAAGGKLDE